MVICGYNIQYTMYGLIDYAITEALLLPRSDPKQNKLYKSLYYLGI